MRKKINYPGCMNAKEVLDCSFDDAWSEIKRTRRLLIVTATVTFASVIAPVIKIAKAVVKLVKSAID